MVALSAARVSDSLVPGNEWSLPQDNAGGTCWKGAMIQKVAAFHRPAADTANSLGVVGVNGKTSTQPTNAGDNKLKVQAGVFRFVVTGTFAAADEGKVMYVSDDQTVTRALGTNAVKAGKAIKRESSTSCLLFISDRAPGRGTAVADADATYGQPEADLINALKVIVNDFLF